MFVTSAGECRRNRKCDDEIGVDDSREESSLARLQHAVGSLASFCPSHKFAEVRIKASEVVECSQVEKKQEKRSQEGTKKKQAKKCKYKEPKIIHELKH